MRGRCLGASIALLSALPLPAHAQVERRLPDRARAARAAIHPVSSASEMQSWLARVPRTVDYPPDFEAALKGQGSAFVIEMSTAPGCVPCGDLWEKLLRLKVRYGLMVRPLGRDEAAALLAELLKGVGEVAAPEAWTLERMVVEGLLPLTRQIGGGSLPRNAYFARHVVAAAYRTLFVPERPRSPQS